MPLIALNPQQAYDRFRERRSQMPAADLFNDPAAGKLRDLWVAAHFGLAYEHEFARCHLLFDEETAHEWDFILDVDGIRNPFQITEALEPGRRRGLEYREVEAGIRSVTTTESWEPGTVNGPEWIRQSIERKKKKCYAGADKLNLLVYANFAAYRLEFACVQATCRPDAQLFHSVWVITGSLLGTLCSRNPFLGTISAGWLRIEQSASESET